MPIATADTMKRYPLRTQKLVRFVDWILRVKEPVNAENRHIKITGNDSVEIILRDSVGRDLCLGRYTTGYRRDVERVRKLKGETIPWEV